MCRWYIDSSSNPIQFNKYLLNACCEKDKERTSHRGSHPPGVHNLMEIDLYTVNSPKGNTMMKVYMEVKQGTM